MIETFFGANTLDSGAALLASLVIGFFFGFALERAGFSSSRKLAGIFYFNDMTVLKVMFTALITAALGLSYFTALGWISPGSLYQMPTIYGGQIAGGLLLGAGFIMGGWCPGTAASGLAAGKMDALLFLGGAIGGSILFNEVFETVKPLYTSGHMGVNYVYQTLGIPRHVFTLLFTLVAVICFWGAEYIEKARGKGGRYWDSPFLKAFSLVLLLIAGGLVILPAEAVQNAAAPAAGVPDTAGLLLQVQQGSDHIEPEILADRLLTGDPSLLLIDVRTPQEYGTFHITGAVNVALADLPSYISAQGKSKTVVLYSNGMTHPAQARDALARAGYGNVFLLTDGLKGFLERCLKPASLRGEPVTESFRAKILAWRRFFLSEEKSPSATETTPRADAEPAPDIRLPGLVETSWLEDNLGDAGTVIVDTRPQPEYNTAHIPGAFSLNVEQVRTNINGLPSMLAPADMLERQFSLMGISSEDVVVLAPGDSIRDATLIGVALERIGHARYVLLNGGFSKWTAEGRPTDTALPSRREGAINSVSRDDGFTVDAETVLRNQRDKTAIILDVRPANYFSGEKSDEARGGHIPGAINRPYTEDLEESEKFVILKPLPDLDAAYSALIPSKETPIIVHCRTGHQATQTFFVLKRLLGYKNVMFYDAGWTEWAARPEFPVEK